MNEVDRSVLIAKKFISLPHHSNNSGSTQRTLHKRKRLPFVQKLTLRPTVSNIEGGLVYNLKKSGKFGLTQFGNQAFKCRKIAGVRQMKGDFDIES